MSKYIDKEELLQSLERKIKADNYKYSNNSSRFDEWRVNNAT